MKVMDLIEEGKLATISIPKFQLCVTKVGVSARSKVIQKAWRRRHEERPISHQDGRTYEGYQPKGDVNSMDTIKNATCLHFDTSSAK